MPAASEHIALDRQRLYRYGADTRVYELAIVTDEDHASQRVLEDGTVAWQSTLRRDRLYRETDPATGRPRYRVEAVPEAEGGVRQLLSVLAEGGRGAELSELVRFGERLLTFDDRTGLVCEIRDGDRLVPRQILMTGSGDERFKGFKSEWATLKGNQLIVGSHGKKRSEEWVKRLDRDYRLQSQDWRDAYERMREAVGVAGTPGYVVHEAVEWHPERERWFFFPRKISTEAFDEVVDERERGANILISADATFGDIDTITVGERIPERGVSSFKMLPGRPDECVGLKSVECGARTATYLFCFDLDGRVLSDDIFLGDYKCEGIEIL